MQEFAVTIQSGEMLKGRHWPAKDAVANLTIITGMDEHSLRYERLALFLNERKVNVWCLDAFGQGLNAPSVKELQQWPRNGFFKNVEGIAKMIEMAKANGLPTTHMGHSMGSFMTQCLLQLYPDLPDRVVLCGSNGGQQLLMSAANIVTKIITTKKKWNNPCPFMDTMGLGGYKKSVKDRKTDFDWLTFNEENVAKYIADPYCGCTNTYGFWHGFTSGMKTIWKKKNIAKVKKDMPILMVSGADDPVGQFGKGVNWLVDAYKSAGLENVTAKIYPHMRHEVFNEDDFMLPFEDVSAFVLAPATKK